MRRTACVLSASALSSAEDPLASAGRTRPCSARRSASEIDSRLARARRVRTMAVAQPRGDRSRRRGAESSTRRRRGQPEYNRELTIPLGGLPPDHILVDRAAQGDGARNSQRSGSARARARTSTRPVRRHPSRARGPTGRHRAATRRAAAYDASALDAELPGRPHDREDAEAGWRTQKRSRQSSSPATTETAVTRSTRRSDPTHRGCHRRSSARATGSASAAPAGCRSGRGPASHCPAPAGCR